MKRLREEIDSTDPEVARMARLLRQTATPADSEARFHRVRRALREKRRRQLGPLLLRPAMVAAILIGALAAAAASSSVRSWVRRTIDQRMNPHPAASVPAKAPSPAPRPSVPALVTTPPPVEEPPRVEPPPRAPKRPRPPAVEHHAVPDPAVSIEQARGRLESRTLVSAVGALRGDHEPEMAAMFLTYYMQRFPEGELAEEALALSVEVEVARRSGKAVAIADRYLARYPLGRYVNAVRALRERAKAAK